VCGGRAAGLFEPGQGGALCATCAEPGARPASAPALDELARLAVADLVEAGVRRAIDPRVRRECRSLLYGFVEYHLERRMRSLPMLARTAP
jgi:DNA repair protein RecO (recombination protein O)